MVELRLQTQKAALFIIAFGTVLIEYKIIDPEKETTKVAISKIWLVYCIPGMQMCLFSTRQILQSRLRMEGNKSGSTFHDKSGDAVLLATPNLWGNIQIIRTCILKHDYPNPMSFAIRHLDFETLHHHFGHTSDKIMHHVFNNAEDMKKICFLT